MKIKSIAAICKKNKQVVLFNRYSDSGTLSQYIGDGNAVYPISGLPELDEESILTIFDVPEKQREDWLVRYRDIPEGISFEDTDATEKIIEQGNLSIVYSGKTLKPLQTRRGLVFIESRYLSPVSDVLDVLELYERVTPFGAPYIVAKAGFLLQAVIMPCDVISAQFVQRLQELTRQCAVSLDLREQEQERQAAAESAGQFKVDPETGAIIEPETDGLKSSWKVAGGGYSILQSPVWARNRQVGSKGIRRGAGRNADCSSHSSAYRYKLFPRFYIPQSGNSLYSWAASVYGRRRQRRRSRALPLYAGDL